MCNERPKRGTNDDVPRATVVRNDTFRVHNNMESNLYVPFGSIKLLLDNLGDVLVIDGLLAFFLRFQCVCCDVNSKQLVCL